MIGVSLPFGWLMGEQKLGLDQDLLLAKLREIGVRSVELRTVRATYRPEDVWTVAKLLWERGF